MEINQIYTELIREHSMNKDNKRPLDECTHTKIGVNPSCGDEISLNLDIKDRIIKDASYEGVGCAISQASASMMIDIMKGKSIEEAKELVALFLSMIKNEVENEDELIELKDAIALESINKLPARVKCAVLAWRTLEDIIEDIE